MAVVLRRYRFTVDEYERLAEARVLTQNPIQLRVVRSMPQPDVVLVRSALRLLQGRQTRSRRRAAAHRGDGYVGGTDRSVKLPLYARTGIAETWLLGLAADRTEVFRRLTATGYSEIETLGWGERLAPRAFPTVDRLFG